MIKRSAACSSMVIADRDRAHVSFFLALTCVKAGLLRELCDIHTAD